MYSNDPALRKCIIKKSGLSKVPEGLKKWAGPHGMVVTNEIVAGTRIVGAVVQVGSTPSTKDSKVVHVPRL